MASTSSSHREDAFSGIEPPSKRRKIEESSRVYDVFINHRGPDVKQTLATQLYKSLRDVDIKAFLDSEEKERGVSFISTIETAIRSASVHIAIFSRKYAESDWCLRELVLMLQSNAKIIPVFYQVEPWELRHIEKGVYSEAFLNYQEKGRYLDKLEEWKEALQQVSYIAGDVFTNPDSSDFKYIVAAVENEVQRSKHLYVAKYPVGLHKLVGDFERQCLGDLVREFESNCRMRKAAKGKANVVGIFGMGGVGKTTLSKELFNQKRSQYTRTSFLFDVREACASDRLPSLQSKLLKDIFCEDHCFLSSEEGTSFLKDRLERNRSFSFLVVLDDIDHVEQLDALLVNDILRKSDNNLVIVTTRNVGVLVSAGIDTGYHLKGLGVDDGRELFCWHAFNQPFPPSRFKDLVEEFVRMCGGLPLSLMVLGRHVFGRDKWYWQDELAKVKETLPGDIKLRLKISIDTLDNAEKQIFMDIACFFTEKSSSKAMTIWQGSAWKARHALKTLKEKCLVEEVKKWESSKGKYALRMHDHLRDLGREMADELSHPRRVWRPRDLKCLGSKGFQEILAQTKGRCFHSILDKSMSCKITYFLGAPEDGSNTTILLWLQLEYQNSDTNSSIFSWIPLQNLQCLRITNGCFKKLWQSDVQKPSYLKELQIFHTFVEEFPDLIGQLDNMQKLVLDAKDICMDITSFLKSLRMNLHSLRITDWSIAGYSVDDITAEVASVNSLLIYGFNPFWKGEMALNNEGTIMSNVKDLEIHSCKLVTKILIAGNFFQSLQSLKICQTENLIEVDLAGIKRLKCLEITDCEKFKRLSATPDICKLADSKISACQQLEEVRLAELSCLDKITIRNCNQLKNVSGISSISKLVELEISGCEMLEFECLCLRDMKHLEMITVGSDVKMKYFELDSCENLRTVIIGCRNIVQLSIRNCVELEKLADLIGPSCLRRIIIDACGNLKYLRLHGLGNLENLSGNMELRQLDIHQCPALEELPSLPRMKCLEITDCEKFKRLSATPDICKLADSKISACQQLEEVRLAELSCLEKITIRNCNQFKIVSGISVSKLVELKISGCQMLESECLCLRDMKHLKKITVDRDVKMKYFELDSCENLRTVIIGCKNIVQLSIRNCVELEKLADLIGPSCLRRIIIDACGNLKYLRLHGLGNLENLSGNMELRQLDIHQCPALEELPSLPRMNCLEKIQFDSCEKLQSIILPTTLLMVVVKSCRDLQSIEGINDLTRLAFLEINECPALEELPSLARLSYLKEIRIDTYEKLQSIILPSTLSTVVVKSCRDLQSIEGIDDLSMLAFLEINECPALEELPSLARLNCLKRIQIFFCEKLQSIVLPSTLLSVWVRSCRDLQRIEGTNNLTKLEFLKIEQCPVLEELPSLSRLSIAGFEELPSALKIHIDSCEMLESIAGFEEMQVLRYLRLSCCNNALIRNCIRKLKNVPWVGMVMIGRAVQGAESVLNENLFHDANISVDRVIEIGAPETHCVRSESRAIIDCYVVTSDTSEEDIDRPHANDPCNKMCQGEWIITMISSRYFHYQNKIKNATHNSYYHRFEDVFGRYRIMKGFRAELKKGEPWKCVDVLRTIVDRLHHI